MTYRYVGHAAHLFTCCSFSSSSAFLLASTCVDGSFTVVAKAAVDTSAATVAISGDLEARQERTPVVRTGATAFWRLADCPTLLYRDCILWK